MSNSAFWKIANQVTDQRNSRVVRGADSYSKLLFVVALTLSLVGCSRSGENATQGGGERENAPTVAEAKPNTDVDQFSGGDGNLDSGTNTGNIAAPSSNDSQSGDEKNRPANPAADAPTPDQPVSPPGLEPRDPNAAPDYSQYDPYGTANPIEEAARKAFAEPSGAKRLVPDGNIWVDRSRGRVIADGYVTLDAGPLEMFACPVGTKEHESIVAVLGASQAVHAGLLALGAVQGTPVSFVPEYRPATGQRIAIWVMWRNERGAVEKVPAQHWVKKAGTEEILDQDWVFAGSSFWQDPDSGQRYYQADSGDLVCVSNFSTATLDLPVESSDSDSALLYTAYSEKIPPVGTPVRMVFVPIPVPTDSPSEGEAAADEGSEGAATDEQAKLVDPKTPPEDELLAPQSQT